MRNGYKVYNTDTHIRPSADTLEKYLSARVLELVPTSKAERCTRGLREESDAPPPKIFRLRRGAGGWGADAPRTLGEAEPRVHASGVSGHFMGAAWWPRTSSTRCWSTPVADVSLHPSSCTKAARW
jgi:hypothetical protein